MLVEETEGRREDRAVEQTEGSRGDRELLKKHRAVEWKEGRRVE